MGKFCLENYFVIDLYSVDVHPLEEASELGFISIKVSFIVLFFSILCYFYADILHNYYFLLYIIHLVLYKWNQSTFLCINFRKKKFRVEMCTIDVFKAQRSIIQRVKLRLGRTSCRKYKGFHELLETTISPSWKPM